MNEFQQAMADLDAAIVRCRSANAPPVRCPATPDGEHIRDVDYDGCAACGLDFLLGQYCLANKPLRSLVQASMDRAWRIARA